MERVGARGEGKWVRLSWEQAYDTLSEKLLQLQERSPGSLVLHSGAEGPGLLARRFVAAFGSRAFIDEAAAHNATPAATRAKLRPTRCMALPPRSA
jgi:anaerobic selenocysteine-containing dehydrogenase